MGWRRPIVKDVAEMRVTCFGTDFRTLHPIGGIPLFNYFVFGHWLCEAGPARAAIEFIFRREERFARDDIDINSILVIVPVGILKGRFRGAFARHLILILGQLLSQHGVAGNWLGRIHFFSFFFLRLSISKQNRADNHNDRAK